MEKLTNKIVREAKRIEEDSNVSARGQFAAASFWTTLSLWVGGATAIASGIAGGSAFSQFDNHNVVAGILASLVAATTAAVTFLKPNDKATSHRGAGNEYTSLRNKARIFREIECESSSVDEVLIDRLNSLSDQRDALNKNSLQIPGRAYKKAIKGIEKGESDYKADS